MLLLKSRHDHFTQPSYLIFEPSIRRNKNDQALGYSDECSGSWGVRGLAIDAYDVWNPRSRVLAFITRKKIIINLLINLTLETPDWNFCGMKKKLGVLAKSRPESRNQTEKCRMWWRPTDQAVRIVAANGPHGARIRLGQREQCGLRVRIRLGLGTNCGRKIIWIE